VDHFPAVVAVLVVVVDQGITAAVVAVALAGITTVAVMDQAQLLVNYMKTLLPMGLAPVAVVVPLILPLLGIVAVETVVQVKTILQAAVVVVLLYLVHPIQQLMELAVTRHQFLLLLGEQAVGLVAVLVQGMTTEHHLQLLEPEAR
jgi:hypothetical protein